MIDDCKCARPGSLLSTCFSISGWVFVSRRCAKSAPQATKYCVVSRANLLSRNDDVQLPARQHTQHNVAITACERPNTTTTVLLNPP